MASEAELQVHLESPLPARIPTGRAAAAFCCGTCALDGLPIEQLELLVDGAAHPADAQRMPRLHAPSSGFWDLVRIPAQDRPGELPIRVRARFAGGGTETVTAATIDVVEEQAPPDPVERREGEDAPIAICMATFEPELELFRRQVDSLREQSERDWICLVSDDCSSAADFAAIEAELDGDPRFVLSRSEERLGFYRNFERALEMIPGGIELVALCDQDDYWYPEKLEVLRRALGDAQLAYSDARLITPTGSVIAETVWEGRPINRGNLTSLMITNTITGAASLFRRRVIDLAVPFPEGPGWQFHDHWLNVVAMACGEVVYVDRPLYDYVQHGSAALGGIVGTGADGVVARRTPRRLIPDRTVVRATAERWKARYFYGYVAMALRAEVLLARCSEDLSPAKRRALQRLRAAETSLVALLWLLARRFRRLWGRGETLGAEGLLATGLLWRRMIGLRSRSTRPTRRVICDTSIPGFDPDSLEPRRWRRRQDRLLRARRSAGG